MPIALDHPTFGVCEREDGRQMKRPRKRRGKIDGKGRDHGSGKGYHGWKGFGKGKGHRNKRVHADVGEPAFVVNGAGAPIGHSVMEHVEWCQSLRHPDAVSLSTRMDADQRNAVEYELAATPPAIDYLRSELVAALTLQAHTLNVEAETWRQNSGIGHLKMCNELNGAICPLFDPMVWVFHCRFEPRR